MGHYVKVVDDIVVNGIVAEPEFFDTFIDSSPGKWIETCYNTRGGKWINPETNTPDPEGGVPLRGNYAGVGYIYDEENDVFYPPKPYPSWTISAPDWTWTSPVPYPSDENFYEWNEEEQVWEQMTNYE